MCVEVEECLREGRRWGDSASAEAEGEDEMEEAEFEGGENDVGEVVRGVKDGSLRCEGKENVSCSMMNCDQRSLA